MCEIRKVSDSGSGSGLVAFPKGQLRRMGLVDEDGNVIDGYLSFEQEEDGTVRVESVQ